MSQEYPIILRDDPVDQDFFDNHGRVADGIYNLITNSKNGVSICLKGKYGSGKSTTIDLLKKKSEKDNILFFCFDMWAHEKDPVIRRSFLIELSEFLIQKEIGIPNIVRRNLDALKGKVKETSANSRITKGEKAIAAFFVLLWLVSIDLASRLPDVINSHSGLWILCICFLIFVLIFWPILLIIFAEKILNIMGGLLNIKLEQSHVSQILVKQVDVTHSDLKSYLNEIVEIFQREDNQNKLVVVLENADRINNGRLMAGLLSEIFGLFFGSYHKNIYTICCVDTSKVKLDTDKLFDAILTIDQSSNFKNKDFFEACLTDAWGDLVSKDQAAKIWHLLVGQADSFTPRRIKKFINDIVAEYLSQPDGNKKDIVCLAAYVMVRENIKNPTDFFDKQKEIIRADLAINLEGEWRNNFAAYYYRGSFSEAIHLTFGPRIREFLLDEGDFASAMSGIEIIINLPGFYESLYSMIGHVYTYNKKEKSFIFNLRLSGILSFLENNKIDTGAIKSSYLEKMKQALSYQIDLSEVRLSDLRLVFEWLENIFRFLDLNQREKIHVCAQCFTFLCNAVISPKMESSGEGFSRNIYEWVRLMHLLDSGSTTGPIFKNLFSSLRVLEIPKSELPSFLMALSATKAEVMKQFHDDKEKLIVANTYLNGIERMLHNLKS